VWKFQSVPDLADCIKKAIAAFKDGDAKRFDGEKVSETVTLTEEQSKRRELYFCYQRNELRSDSLTILANVGLACLAIRRLLKARLFFLRVNIILI
jgi:hypothetical protein